MPSAPNLRTVILTGGANIPLATRLAKIVADNLNVICVIAGKNSVEGLSETVMGVLSSSPRLFHSNRPDLDAEIMAFLREYSPAYLINTGYDYIVRKEIFDQLTVGAINLHPALLPLNRGCHHSFWGIMEGTLHGATIHWMNEGLDAGDIIDQESYEDDGVMSAAQVFDRSHGLLATLLERNLPSIIKGTAPRRTQPENGTYHAKKDIQAASTLDYDDTVQVGHVLKLCRATDCKGHGFYVRRGSKLYLVRAQVSLVEKA